MKVIFSNDDFGLTFGITDAVRDCFTKGLTTSASIMVNGTAYPYAVKSIKTGIKKIGVGIHLNLTDGRANIRQLGDSVGNYKYSFLKIYILTLSPNAKLLKLIEKDLEIQINKAISDGLNLDHLDSDKHVHMIPPVFKIVCRLCRKYKIPYVRITREPLFLITPNPGIKIHNFITNLIKHFILSSLVETNLKTAKKYGLKVTDAFYGVLYTNSVNSQVIISTLNDALRRKYKLIEILGHPGYIKDHRDKYFISKFMGKYTQMKNRQKEAQAFEDIKVLNFLQKNKIQKVSFRDII